MPTPVVTYTTLNGNQIVKTDQPHSVNVASHKQGAHTYVSRQDPANAPLVSVDGGLAEPEDIAAMLGKL